MSEWSNQASRKNTSVEPCQQKRIFKINNKYTKTATAPSKALLFISSVALEPNCKKKKKYISLRKQYRTHPLHDNKLSMPQQNTVYTSKNYQKMLICLSESIEKTKTSRSNSPSVAVYNEPRLLADIEKVFHAVYFFRF